MECVIEVTDITEQPNTNFEYQIYQGICETIVELLAQLRGVHDSLHKEIMEAIRSEQTQKDLTVFLFLIQNVFATYTFDLEFNKDSWDEGKVVIGTLRTKYKLFEKILDAYLDEVDLKDINFLLTDEQVNAVDNKINAFFRN